MDKPTIAADDDGVIAVPALVRGTLVAPPAIGKREIEAAFAAQDRQRAGGDSPTVVRLNGAWVLREPVLDRASMRATGAWQYQVLPAVTPLDLVEDDLDALAAGLYDLEFGDVLRYVDGLQQAYGADAELLRQVKEWVRATSEAPDPYVEAGFAMFPVMLAGTVAETMVDTDLAAWGDSRAPVPGRLGGRAGHRVSRARPPDPRPASAADHRLRRRRRGAAHARSAHAPAPHYRRQLAAGAVGLAPARPVDQVGRDHQAAVRRHPGGAHTSPCWPRAPFPIIR